MKRFALVVPFFALALSLLAIPLPAETQTAGKVPRVGWMGGLDAPMAGPFVGPFLEEMRKLGYVEGKTIAYEFRWAQGRFERFADQAIELARLKVDLLVAPVDAAALAAQKATSTIPIVTVAVGDPVSLGLVQSLARPGGNVTGLTSLSIDLSAKQLQLLRDALPSATRIAVLWNPANPGMAPQLVETRRAAGTLGVQLQILEARHPAELERAFAVLTRGPAEALLVLADPLFFPMRTNILELAARHRLPAAHGFREFTEAGGLMSYGVNLRENYGRAAEYVDRILKGAKPADLPVEQPTKFELVINLKTAKALGLTIPQSVLVRADEVIQ